MAEGTHPEQRAGASRWQRASRLSKLPSPARPCQALTSAVKPGQALSKLPRLSAATRSGAELTVCCHCFDSSRCASSSWRRWGDQGCLCFGLLGSNSGITVDFSCLHPPPSPALGEASPFPRFIQAAFTMSDAEEQVRGPPCALLAPVPSASPPRRERDGWAPCHHSLESLCRSERREREGRNPSARALRRGFQEPAAERRSARACFRRRAGPRAHTHPVCPTPALLSPRPPAQPASGLFPTLAQRTANLSTHACAELTLALALGLALGLTLGLTLGLSLGLTLGLTLAASSTRRRRGKEIRTTMTARR